MDLPDSTKVVFDRIQKMEPELVSKIVGYLLLKESSNREMIRLAFGPDNAIQSLINEAKVALSSIAFSSQSVAHVSAQQTSESLQYVSYSSTFPRPICSPETLHISSPYWEHQPALDQQSVVHNIEVVHSPYSNTIGEDIHQHSHTQFMGMEEQPDTGDSTMSNLLNNYYHQNASFSRSVSPLTSRRSISLPECPVKACQYFYKGYCKHGTSCRYFHGQAAPHSFAQVQSPSSDELANDDHVFSPASLEKLEVELTELLKSREGQPISIAMLPMMYCEKYGRQLQADGYLTESQRHGKAGYSLTKLLARLKNSIRLLDRPHGQHSVMLAEDVPRHLEYRNERSDFGNVVSGSQQIYLTFPSESTFTEDDVYNYFKQYGPVQAVRIPTQQKRMFGFVTFVYPETVKMILAKGNPHYVCGSRVLVKPYREKTRKYSEKFDYPIYCPQYTDIDHGIHPSPRFCHNNEMLRNQQLNEEQDPTIELQLKRLAQFQIAPMPVVQQPYLCCRTQEMRISDPEISSENHFIYRLVASTNVPTNNENARNTGNSNIDQDSQLELPESPFASHCRKRHF